MKTYSAALLLYTTISSMQCIAKTTDSKLLEKLSISPSAESFDYVNHKTQFQLHGLITEQRHPKTWNLSFKVKQSVPTALDQLFSVDEDVSKKMEQLAKDAKLLNQASLAIERAIEQRKKIYFYGCGATGRLAKQVESSFWRPFWERVKASKAWDKIKDKYSGVEDELIGEMTGGDRALISSLPGFEDLQLIGRLQLKDRGVQKGDVVFAITEGGETSSVIGTILGALDQYGELTPKTTREAKENLYFVYNNPDSVLLPFDRSRAVLKNPAITKISLFTGPQAIAGSTRMQATTSETFFAGVILENAIYQALKDTLSADELQELGFHPNRTLSDRLRDFVSLQKKVRALKGEVALLTDVEASTYSHQHFSTYFADDALITVFTDSTERSPTFRLLPLDTVKEPHRKSFIQVWSPATNAHTAWDFFLHRPFRGLDPTVYQKPFNDEISDPFLKESALKSLLDAGNDQQALYDFSFSESNVSRAGPQKGDVGGLVLLSPEIRKIEKSQSIKRWLKLFHLRAAPVFAILVSSDRGHSAEAVNKITSIAPETHTISLITSFPDDPLYVREHIGIKMLLNAHSTAVMAKLGKVVGNTMTNVNPGNLKLIGRATYLIQSHVNDAISSTEWTKQHGKHAPISYAEANAVLFDAISYVSRTRKVGQISEVGLSIVRLLESMAGKQTVTWADAEGILEKQELGDYLLKQNPQLGI